jgi:hypothetical protein
VAVTKVPKILVCQRRYLPDFVPDGKSICLFECIAHRLDNPEDEAKICQAMQDMRIIQSGWDYK